MEYLVAFLEGVITFVSPCLLPMLPVYVLYFTGGKTEAKKYTALKNSLGFVLGFSVLFILMGAFAASVGNALKQHQTAVNIVSGAIVVLFGLNFLGIIKIGFLNKTSGKKVKMENLGFFSSAVFGAVFGVSWTPCVSAFLGSALMLASQQASVGKGIAMLSLFSLGLGIPFVLSAVLIEQLKGAFRFIKRHYTIINFVSGLLLVVIGIFMMTGYLNTLLGLIRF